MDTVGKQAPDRISFSLSPHTFIEDQTNFGHPNHALTVESGGWRSALPDYVTSDE